MKVIRKIGYIEKINKLAIFVPAEFFYKLEIYDKSSHYEVEMIVDNNCEIYWILFKCTNKTKKKNIRRILFNRRNNSFIVGLDNLFIQELGVTIGDYMCVELIKDDTKNDIPKLLIYKKGVVI